MTLFLSLFYTLFCLGYITGILVINDDIPNPGKVLMLIFSPILAPLFLGVGFGINISHKLNKKNYGIENDYQLFEEQQKVSQ